MSTSHFVKTPCPCRRLGSGPKHHFFCYYNKTVWDRSGRYLLANRFELGDANLTPELVAEVGYFDLQDNDRFHVIDTTTTWNWQMGCQYQWLDGMPGRQVIYNTRRTATNPGPVYPSFGSTVCNLDTGEKRELPLPVYVVSPDSRFALSVDYSRLWITHETIGYVEPDSPKPMTLAPDNDGIYCMDIATGKYKLAISYADMFNFHHVKSMNKAIHWVSHIEINPTSSRFLFLHRWTERVKDETCFLHRLITANPDGSDMRLLECSDHPLPQLADDFDPNAVGTYDYEKSEWQISHPLWCSKDQIVVWGPHGRNGIQYNLYTDDNTFAYKAIAKGVLTENGHMSFSPVNMRWLLSDTYPDSTTNERILFIYDMETGLRHDIGSFYADPKLKKENRCDLHPRWSRDGLQVCIDSVHEHERQMYVLDVSALVGK